MKAGRPIEVQNRHPRLACDAPAVARALRRLDLVRDRVRTGDSVLERAGGREALTVTFVTDAELARLHGRFLNDPTPTDVITFPAAEGFGLAGEICVSADAAARQAPDAGHFSGELLLYVVHGWLHLAGHDDRRPAAKRRMRRAERAALAAIRRGGALPRFRLRDCGRRRGE